MDKEKLYAVTAIAILSIGVVAFAVVGMTETQRVNEVTPGAYVEFGAIGPVPEGVYVPSPGVTYIGTEQERRDAAIKNILEEQNRNSSTKTND